MKKGMDQKIKEILEIKNMSQKELAKLSGLTEAAVSHYINGTRIPRGANLIRIANALGISVDELLYRDEDRTKDDDLSQVKLLIARNANDMTDEDRLELISLLMKASNK